MNGSDSSACVQRALARGIMAMALLLLPALARPARTPTLAERVRVLRHECDNFHLALFKSLRVTAPCSVLGRPSPNATEDQLATKMARALGISRDAATPLVKAELGSAWIERAGSTPVELEQIADQYLAAVKAAPDNLAVLASFAVRFRLPDGGRIAAAMETGTKPVTTAVRLLEAGRRAKEGTGVSAWESALRALALARGTAANVAAVLTTDQYHDGESGAAVDLGLLERTVQPGAEPDVVARSAALLLEAAVLAHLPDVAAQAFRGLSPAARAASLARLAEKEAVGHDARLDLAVALAAAGDLDLAHEARASVPSKLLDEWRTGEDCQLRLGTGLLAVLLDNTRLADPFDLAVDAAVCGDDPVLSLLAAPIVGARYADAVRGVLDVFIEDAGRSRLAGSEDRDEVGDSVRVFLPACAARVDAAHEDFRGRLERARAALPAPVEAASTPADPVAATVARLLEKPPRSPFVERPLPAAGAARVPKRGSARAPSVLTPPNLMGWGGVDAVRVERSGSSVTAVVLSQKLDPTGEVSGGGYFLFESGDAGRSWHSTYLGLRHFRPYEIEPDARVPLLKDGVLRLVARVREIDERTIIFPPVATGLKRECKPVLLEARLEELHRDSDGDCLTDLEEERLLTDAAQADTDGDGFLDGEDPLPHVPFGDLTPEASVLSTLLADGHGAGELTGLLVPPGSDRTKLATRHTPEGADRVRFVVGDRSRLRGMRSSGRIVVLGPSELEKALARFGRFYPLRIVTLMRSVDGNRVYLEWSEGWRGGSAVARRTAPGGWELDVVRSWIT